MIEMRWLRFTNTRQNSLGGSYEYKDRKLQYRWLSLENNRWSQWQDVPMVELEEVGDAPLQARCR